VSTVRMSVAAAVVAHLARQFTARDGIERRLVAGIGGIFGHGNVAGLGQAISAAPEVLPFWQPKNEQAMVHAAAAFAKTHRRLSTLACTTSIGPGATNMVTGAAGATINRLPVLLLPGDVFANHIPDPVLQQLEHPSALDTSVNDCFRPVSRLWDRITRPEQLLRTLPEAMRVLASPVETGAVTVCLPQDVQAELWDWPQAFFARRVWAVPRPRAGPSELADATALLSAARRPFLIAGGGVHYSGRSHASRQGCIARRASTVHRWRRRHRHRGGECAGA
jgi:3D-(3,5/4)-trihydroxycyclohexane-1,2-dione acylhydrolase (decyclizing)